MKPNIIISVLVFCLAGCMANAKTKAGRIVLNDDDHSVRKIEIDSACVSNLKKFVNEKYGFDANAYSCEETKKFKRTVHFHYVYNVDKDTPYPIDDRYVLVILGDSCQIDSVISSIAPAKQ